MKLDLMNLSELQMDDEHVAANIKILDAADAKVTAAKKYVEGMRNAVRAVCEHRATRAIYDPGYAGGGYDYTKCDTCGARLP